MPLFHPLCPDCDESLQEFVQPRKFVIKSPLGDIAVLSLARYTSNVRTLIHKAKIHGERIPFQIFLSWIEKNSVSISYILQNSKVIIPCPSSAWGRLRGRFDISAILAKHLASSSGISIRSAPHSLFWNFTKRAKSRRKHEGKPLIENWIGRTLDESDEQHLIFIDDVITTGSTILNLQKHFIDYEVRAVVLADAIGDIKDE